MRVCRSPELFAAYRGLPRLRVPRHPPHAFVRLTTIPHRQAEHARSSRVTILRKSTQFDSLSHDLPLLPLSNSDAKCRATARHERTIEMGIGCRDVRPTVRFSADLVRGGLTHQSVKEVIQPQVPLRLPCYDFAPVTALAFGRLPLVAQVATRTSGAHSFHGVTGGVYKARERIHRGVADPRLLAIPASCRRVADDNPN